MLRAAARAALLAGNRLSSTPTLAPRVPGHVASLSMPWSLEISRGFPCSSRLNLPPPKLVNVEYDPAHVDDFIAVADAVEEEFYDVAVEGNPGVGKGPRKGSFEVSLEDGSLLFSTLQAGRLPRTDEVLAALRELHTPAVPIAPDDASCRI